MQGNVKTGNISYLRVHRESSKYGPPRDQIDAEVIVKLANADPLAFGIPLKTGKGLPAAQAMFAILRDAFNANEPVRIEYEEQPGRQNHYVVRVIRMH
jgi:hypothetical protein